MLGEILGEAARRFGDRPAYVGENGAVVTYRDLDRLSDEVASWLTARGVGEGDVVALALPTVPEYPVLYLAAAKVGAITAGVNARLAPPERAGVLAVARPKLVVATADLAVEGFDTEIVEPAADVAEMLAGLRRAGESPPALPDDPDRPVAIVFTSGTTGAPKGALFCNRQLAFITSVDVGDRWGGGGVGLAGTSLAHLGFMSKLPGFLRQGSTSYMVRRWRADEALRLTAEHKMTSVAGIPTQVALMLRVPDFDRYDLSCVRAIVIGGGPATPALVREARERFRAPLAVRYSCTESGIGVGTSFTDPPEDAEETVGRPLPGVELALLDPDDRPVPPGEVGAVCLRSPAVMSAYWGDPDQTAAAFTPDGFVRTGDLGWLDERGRLHLAGRAKEMYVRGGYNVYPLEVEAVLATHPAVAAVAVVPRPDPVMGEVGVAVVVPRDPARPPTLDDLRAHGAGRLAAYKLPEDLRVVAELPLTAMEKVDRRALVALAAADPPSTPPSSSNSRQ
jgi:acyl-CoA synthetase (AMP-forming)/AMP-acid ligase II